jgi:hypothetical protein
MYGTLIPFTNETQCSCVSIDYTFVDSKTLSVINSFIDHTPQGLRFEPADLSSSKATLKALNTQTKAGEVFVRMAPAFLRGMEKETEYHIAPLIFGGIYEVLKFGPLNSENLYDWAGMIDLFSSLSTRSVCLSVCHPDLCLSVPLFPLCLCLPLGLLSLDFSQSSPTQRRHRCLFSLVIQRSVSQGRSALCGLDFHSPPP